MSPSLPFLRQNPPPRSNHIPPQNAPLGSNHIPPQKREWVDSHCHLYDLGDDDEIDAALERARRAGVGDVVVLAVDAATSRRAVELAAEDGVWAGVGHHPTGAKDWSDAFLDEMMPLLARDEVVAVGESGLDLYWDKSFLADQVAAFQMHIELAKRFNKALVIHTRNSASEAIGVLTDVGAPERLVFHCWSGDEGQLGDALALGAYISFAGNVSFKNAEDLREAARRVPATKLLVETDSPYLAPVPHRGKPNEPAYVVHVGAAVAAARREEVEALAARTGSNAKTLFGIRG
jgi:TatD DNase family protein